MPIILATQEAEIRRIAVQSQPGQIVHKTPSQKTNPKDRAGRVAQAKGPEFKPQHHKKTQKKRVNYETYILLKYDNFSKTSVFPLF
jgi:hypothetical protein